MEARLFSMESSRERDEASQKEMMSDVVARADVTRKALTEFEHYLHEEMERFNNKMVALSNSITSTSECTVEKALGQIALRNQVLCKRMENRILRQVQLASSTMPGGLPHGLSRVASTQSSPTLSLSSSLPVRTSEASDVPDGLEQMLHSHSMSAERRKNISSDDDSDLNNWLVIWTPHRDHWGPEEPSQSDTSRDALESSFTDGNAEELTSLSSQSDGLLTAVAQNDRVQRELNQKHSFRRGGSLPNLRRDGRNTGGGILNSATVLELGEVAPVKNHQKDTKPGPVMQMVWQALKS